MWLHCSVLRLSDAWWQNPLLLPCVSCHLCNSKKKKSTVDNDMSLLLKNFSFSKLLFLYVLWCYPKSNLISRGASSTWENFSQMGEQNVGIQPQEILSANGRTLFHKALCRLRGTFAGDKSTVQCAIPRTLNYPISPSTSKFHRLLLE